MPIGRIRHKGLRELFDTGRTGRIAAPLQGKALLILDLLDNMESPADCRGVCKFHALAGDRAGSFAFAVSKNWRLTFVWRQGMADDVDFEDYH
ncbi:MAG: type II toxin-antitoxin system RelE/ParE family toxin [Rhodospirillales bacterium]|nr:type II toxin-antitoxin system RelE/ParE family toxin [Rhodospirillales bacterium]